MLGYSSYGSRRDYATRTAKRYASDMIAQAWAGQESPDGRCPASMSFEGGKFYSYATVIATRIEDAGRVVFLVSEERYSPSTGQHLYRVQSAIRSHGGRVFTVPGVYRGNSDLADMPRILSAWQERCASKVDDSKSSREPKHTRLILEAFAVYEQMREFAEFFHLSLRDYPVAIPVPLQDRCRLVAESMGEDGNKVFARIVAHRLGADPSPWMRHPHHGTPDTGLIAAVTELAANSTAAARPNQDEAAA